MKDQSLAARKRNGSGKNADCSASVVKDKRSRVEGYHGETSRPLRCVRTLHSRWAGEKRKRRDAVKGVGLRRGDRQNGSGTKIEAIPRIEVRKEKSHKMDQARTVGATGRESGGGEKMQQAETSRRRGRCREKNPIKYGRVN